MIADRLTLVWIVGCGRFGRRQRRKRARRNDQAGQQQRERQRVAGYHIPAVTAAHVMSVLEVDALRNPVNFAILVRRSAPVVGYFDDRPIKPAIMGRELRHATNGFDSDGACGFFAPVCFCISDEFPCASTVVFTASVAETEKSNASVAKINAAIASIDDFRSMCCLPLVWLPDRSAARHFHP